MVKMKPINVSNTTLSTYKGNRHRKFDNKQTKRHDFGTAHCAICDEVFTKYHHNAKICSEEKCQRERKAAYSRKYREENREKLVAYDRKWREENPDKKAAYGRKYHEENREKELARQRNHYEENREKELARKRKYYEENRDEINARARARYHANKEK
jgi:hypothetical protein